MPDDNTQGDKARRQNGAKGARRIGSKALLALLLLLLWCGTHQGRAPWSGT